MNCLALAQNGPWHKFRMGNASINGKALAPRSSRAEELRSRRAGYPAFVMILPGRLDGDSTATPAMAAKN